MAGDHTQDRRRSRRFPLRLDLHWRSLVIGEEGDGQIINISRAGILFTSEQEFGIGDGLELSILWPVMMDHNVPLKLVAFARVVRCEDGRIAVSIQRYEFKLRGALDLHLTGRISARGTSRLRKNRD